MTNPVHTDSPVLTDFDRIQFYGEDRTGLGSGSRLDQSDRPVQSGSLNHGFTNTNQEFSYSIKHNKLYNHHMSSYIILLKREMGTLISHKDTNSKKSSWILPRFQAWISRKQVLSGGTLIKDKEERMRRWDEKNEEGRGQLSFGWIWEGEIRIFRCLYHEWVKRTCMAWLVDSLRKWNLVESKIFMADGGAT